MHAFRLLIIKLYIYMQFSWGPLLKDVSRLDTIGFVKSKQIAQKIKQQLEAGQFVGATDSWEQLEGVISKNSNSVVIALIFFFGLFK